MKTIFNKKKIFLFEPYDGIEFIYSILQNIGYYPDFTTKEARRDGLRIINNLFELDLIEIFHWGEYQKELKGKDIPLFDKMMYLQELWFEGADFADFTNMPMFKYKDWYIESLKNLGMNHYRDWEQFVNDKIVNLEEWIENNRPKQL